MLDVRLLGTFEARENKKAVIIPSRPAQSLFAYLILNAGTSHRREKLAGLLWPDSLEETARDNLRHALWKIRKALPSPPKTEYLLADDLTIAFNASADYRLDADELEKIGDDASPGELMKALPVYQGELLPGFYDEWALLEREHLNSIFEHKMGRLITLLQDECRWMEIMDWGERWVKLGQKPETAYRALMSAHAAKGEMSQVAAVYERCVKSLKEFGIEPSEQTKELYNNLTSGREIPKPALVESKPPAREPHSNIPVALTSFIGRESELKEVASLLASSRLLTLTGPGGVGKTRIAIRAAGDLMKKFKDGVFWVNLTGLSDENLIPQEIAKSLDIRMVSNEPVLETLIAGFGSKELLIVLDNCEHVIRSCAKVAETLLSACPKLKIMATSSEALGLFNETIWQVPSLPLPDQHGPFSFADAEKFASIKLFSERAVKAKPGFAVEEENVASVTQICRRLDGIPLAIELAAARVKVLSADEIASRLDDRFSLLTSGSRTAIPRHQTLRAAIDWSYELLTEPERRLFRRLSVFTGGFTLEAAEEVCGEAGERSETLELLARLVDKSLVIVDDDKDVRKTRYHLLETLRQYALEKLAGTPEAREIRDRHAEFFVKYSEEAETKIFTSEAAASFERMDRELDNLRSAMEWSTNSGKAIAALRIAGSLSYLIFVRGPLINEWQARIQQALSRPEGLKRTLTRAKALNGIGLFYWADVYPIDKRSTLEEALSIGEELGDNFTIATALRNLGLIESIQGDYSKARSLYEKSLELWRTMGTDGRIGSIWTLLFLGDVAINLGEDERARALHEEATAIFRESGERNLLAYTVRRLGQLARRAGDFERASALCKESLVINRELGDPRGALAALSAFGGIAAARGNYERAAKLLGAVEAQLAASRIRLLPIDGMDFERSAALVEAKMEKPARLKIWARGGDMSMDEIATYALEGP